jgi:hypothetical protein
MAFARSFGWSVISAHAYAETWQRFGGSVITHPDILDFLHQRFDCKPCFLGKTDKQGNLSAAIATWGNTIAGDKSALARLGIDDRYDFGSPEVILPLGPDFRGLIGYRSKFVSQIHQNQIINSYSHNRTRTLCLAKGLGPEGMSSRQKRTRRNDLSHLLRFGGEIRKASDYTPSQLAEIYNDLYQRRWDRPHPHREHLAEMMTALWPHITGHVILFDQKPVAYQFLLFSTSDRYYSLEFVNSGVDPEYFEHSVGSVLTWINIEQAWQAAESKNLECRYSFGRNSYDYKAQWAYEVKLHRILTC